jgi:hypothetical protein
MIAAATTASRIDVTSDIRDRSFDVATALAARNYRGLAATKVDQNSAACGHLPASVLLAHGVRSPRAARLGGTLVRLWRLCAGPGHELEVVGRDE